MNNSHQQSSKGNIDSKCKNTRKHTLVAKEMELCRNFQQDKSLKKVNSMRRGRIGKGKKFAEFFSLLTSNWSIYKEKSKVKDNF